MQEILPSTFEMACISRWESYPRRLWKTTGMVVVWGLSRSFRLQTLCAAPRYFPVIWQWSRTVSPSSGFSHTWQVMAALKTCQSSGAILMTWGWPAPPWSFVPHLESLLWSAPPRCVLGILRVVLPVHHSGRPHSNSCRSRGAASSECCSSWGRARAPLPLLLEPRSRRSWWKGRGAACGGFGRSAYFPPLRASPPSPPSDQSHGIQAYGLPAGLPWCSREGSARKSAYAPGDCSGHTEGGWDPSPMCNGTFLPYWLTAGWL